MTKMTSLELEISNPCNEKCLHCYRTLDATKKGFLSLSDARSVLEQAKSLGAKNATITGGEVLLNPEWKSIVQTASDLGFRTSLFTNGSLMTQNDVDFLKSVKNLKMVQISLYSLEEGVHDKITGLSGSCKKTKAAIKMLRSANVPLFVSCPAMKENLETVSGVMAWCDENKIESCCDVSIFDSLDKSNASHRLDNKDLKKFFEITMCDNGKLAYVWGKSHGKRDLTKINFYGSATSSLLVSGDGNIYPMIGWYEKLGNIETDNLIDIYNNHPLLKKIRKIKVSDFAECRECDAVDFCVFCPSAHLSANNYELMKLDNKACESFALYKKFAQERDRILGK